MAEDVNKESGFRWSDAGEISRSGVADSSLSSSKEGMMPNEKETNEITTREEQDGSNRLRWNLKTA